MNVFQLLILAAAAFFAYKVYEHIQTLESSDENSARDEDINDNIDHDKYAQLVEKIEEDMQAQNYAQVIEHSHTLLEQKENDVEVLNSLAYAYMKEGNSRNALKYYERSLALDNNDDITHLAFASLLKEIREYKKAKEHYLEAIRIDDTYEITYFNYANLLVEMDEIEEAKKMYKKAITLKADFNQAKFELTKLS